AATPALRVAEALGNGLEEGDQAVRPVARQAQEREARARGTARGGGEAAEGTQAAPQARALVQAQAEGAEGTEGASREEGTQAARVVLEQAGKAPRRPEDRCLAARGGPRRQQRLAGARADRAQGPRAGAGRRR